MGDATRRAVIGSAGAALAALGAAAGRASAQDTDGVRAETLKAAEALAGVEHTDAEREQMLAGLEGQLDTIRALRAIDKPNSLAPAQTFDPRLQGVAYDVGFGEPSETIQFGGGPRPADPADVAYAPALAQQNWMASGDLTSRELTDIYLDRIGRLDPTLMAWVHVDAEGARAAADQADAERAAGTVRGSLHGIPYGLKDLFDAKGLVSTWGAQTYKDTAPARADSTVVAKLREAGAVLLGKTTCGALAYGDIWFGGVTRNPFSPAEGSSGSSAGSASAVAAGLCSFAIGTETLGSIVSPSHRCGATGLRPTFGRVSRAGAMALCWSLDKVGPITRSVADTANVLAAITGADARDPSSLVSVFNRQTPSVRDLVVGYDPAWYENAAAPDLAARDALKEAGVTLVERAMPQPPGGALVLALLVEAAAAFEELTLSDRDDELTWQEDAAWPNTFRAARFVSAIDYVQIDRIRRRAMAQMHDAFEGLDAMVGPNFAGGMLTTTNFTGHPQLALRAGFIDTPPRTIFGQPMDPGAAPVRAPYASSLWAPLFKENVLIQLGEVIENALGVAKERPPLG